MSEVIDSIEPTETAGNAEISEEVETNGETSSADVDNMTDSEFADFEAEAFDKPTDPDAEDEAGAKDKAAEGQTSPEVLSERYRAQMETKDGKLDNPVLVNIKGQIFEIDNINELKNLAELGTNATQKFQSIAQHRKTLDYMQDNDISQDDLDYLVQSRGGAAIVRDESVNAVEDIASNILSGPGAEAFQTVAAQLPADVKEVMSQNPQMLAGFNHDVQSGLAQKIMPLVSRFMNVNQMTFMQAYQAAGDQVTANNAQASEPTVVIDNVADERKRTLQSQPKPRANVSAGGMSRDDMDKMSDSDFDKYWETV